MSPENPTPEPATGTLVKRRALKLGLLASLFALIGRATARAQGAVTNAPTDALTVEPDGVTINNALNVTGAATVGSLTAGPVKIKGNNALELGAGITKEGSAGQIAYQKHSTDSLDIVGAGTTAASRKISMWAEGGAKLHGTLTADHAKILGTLTADAATLDGTLTAGPVKIKGKNVLELGAGITKEQSAGQIAYQAHSGDSLDIVGAGTTVPSRKISMWAEGGATLHGTLTADGAKINGKNALELGADITKEVSAGQIAYQKFSGDSLDIVGAGTTVASRKIKMFAEGGATLNGPIWVNGSLNYYWAPDKAWKHIENRAGDWAGSYSSSGPSDRRFKTALRPIGGALDKVLQLSGMYYRWSETGLRHFTRDIPDAVSAGPDATEADNQKLWDAEEQKARRALAGDRVGLIAQELQTVVPELVHEDKEGYKYIRYPELTALLVEAIKEQNALIQALSARLSALQA